MVKKLFFIALTLLCLEFLVYLYAAQMTDILDMRFQLAARYSGRLSFLIFSGMVVWIGVEGLKEIFRYENSRKLLVFWFCVLAINHLIHFYFLAITHHYKGWDLLVLRSAGGTLVYLVMILCPIFLILRPVWGSASRNTILFSLVFIDIIFAFAYLRRLFQEIEMASPTYYYITALVVIGVGLVLNIYRLIEDGKKRDISSL